jgi:hypothetical protein
MSKLSEASNELCKALEALRQETETGEGTDNAIEGLRADQRGFFAADDGEFNALNLDMVEAAIRAAELTLPADLEARNTAGRISRCQELARRADAIRKALAGDHL